MNWIDVRSGHSRRNSRNGSNGVRLRGPCIESDVGQYTQYARDGSSQKVSVYRSCHRVGLIRRIDYYFNFEDFFIIVIYIGDEKASNKNTTITPPHHQLVLVEICDIIIYYQH